MKFNMNAQATVTLTAAGAAIYNIHMGRYATTQHQPERLSAGSVLQTELWKLMQVFGAHIYMGMGEVPFEENCLHIVDVS